MVSALFTCCECTCFAARYLPGADKISYDPDFEEWQVGKLSALREIALALEGQYGYYYMGQHHEFYE